MINVSHSKGFSLAHRMGKCCITASAIAVMLWSGGNFDPAVAQFTPPDRGTPEDLEPGGTRAVDFTLLMAVRQAP